MIMKPPNRRETTQVTAICSLVSDQKTCSLVNNYESMPRRGNRCDIVSGRDFPEVFRRLRHVFRDLSEANVRQLSIIRAANYPSGCGQQLRE